MRALAPTLLLLACKGPGPSTPTDPSTPTVVVPPPTPVACSGPTPFRFDVLREPLFLDPPTETLTRTYTGRVVVPLESNLDLSAMWLLDQPVTITQIAEDEFDAIVSYEVTATCTHCDHASVRLESISSDLVLTAPTLATGDPVTASFSLESTAFMLLGLSSASGGPAIAEPVAYTQRPDLNPFVADIGIVLADAIALRNTTGITVHGQPLNGSEALLGADEALADPGVARVPPVELPWLLPIAQDGVAQELVIWGPRGRSASLPAVDGRFLVDLPFDGEPSDYAFRFVGPDGLQGRSSTLRYPPNVGTGDLEVRPLDVATRLLDVRGTPDAWVALRTADSEPIVCRADADGRTLFARPSGEDGASFELAVVDARTLQLDAHRICTLGIAISCR